MDTKKLTGLNLTDSELDEATRRLAFFAPTGSKAYVDELYEFLTQQALASLEPGLWRGREVYAKLHKLTGIRLEYEVMLSTLGRLAQQQIITSTMDSVYHEEAKFSFEDMRQRDTMLQLSKKQQRHQDDVMTKWKEELTSSYPDLKKRDIDVLENDLREYTYRLASQSSAETVLLYYAGHNELSEIAERLDAGSLEQILPKRSESLTKLRAEILPNFFRTKDVNRKRFIDGLLQSTFILHMIQLDPTCSAIVQGQILGGTVYLDTNFIFRLVGLHSPEMFFAARALVNLSRKLNYTLAVTPVTIAEYQHALVDNLRDLHDVPKLPTDLLNLVIDIADNEDPILAYYRKIANIKTKNRGSYVSPSVFIDYYKEIEDLLEPYEIKFSDEQCESILNESQELALEASRLKRYVDEKRSSKNKLNYQELNPYVAEHDAFHRLLILRLRSGYDGVNFFDVPYWFLTCDSKLPGYDRVRRISEGHRTPFCVMSAQWIQTLRPFEPNLDAEALVDSISSPLLGSFNPIPNSMVIEVAGRLQMHEKYNPAVGKLAMKRQFLLQFAQASAETQKEDLIQSVFADYAEQMERLKKEEEQGRLKAEADASKLRAETATLKSQIQELTETLTNRSAEQERELAQYLQSQSQIEANLQTLSKAVNVERQVRIDTEKKLDETELDRIQKQNQVEQLQDYIDNIGNKFDKYRRILMSFIIVASFLIILALLRPKIEGPNGYFVLTGILTTLYLCLLIWIDRSTHKNRKRVFIFGFPVLILLSIALPLGRDEALLETIGTISNIAGFISAILMLVFDD